MDKLEVEVKDRRESTSVSYELLEESTILDLLEEIDVNLETVVVRLNGMIVPEEDVLEDGDDLEIISVVSGG